MPRFRIQNRWIAMVHGGNNIVRLHKGGECRASARRWRHGLSPAILHHKPLQFARIIARCNSAAPMFRATEMRRSTGVPRSPAPPVHSGFALGDWQDRRDHEAVPPKSVAVPGKLAPHVLLNALDGGLGCQSRRYGIPHAASPALVVCRHLHRFKDILVLAAPGRLRFTRPSISSLSFSSRRKRVSSSPGIVGEKFDDCRSGLMKEHMAKSEAFRQRDVP